MMIKLRLLALLMATFAGLGATAQAHAQMAAFDIAGSGGEYNIPVQSYSARKFKEVIKQRYDYSCGSAALATMLNRFYGHNITEKEALTAMYAVGDQEKIRKEGFSMLDMKAYLDSIGYTADGYRDSLDKLRKVGIPAIALINANGYHHFVVISGVNDDSVVLLDSARGKRIMRRHDFEEQWNQILFIIRNEMNVAKASFNKKGTWAAHQQARFNVPVNATDLVSSALQNAYMPGYF
jgi:predicted double-glycine peptidase